MLITLAALSFSFIGSLLAATEACISKAPVAAETVAQFLSSNEEEQF
jgi:hypothetical protein